MWLALFAVARGDVEMPRPNPQEPIVFGGDRALQWKQGQYDVWLLEGHCTITQGSLTTNSEQAVLWIRPGTVPSTPQNMVIAYLEGQVTVAYTRAGYPYEVKDRTWFGEFFSTQPIQVRTPPPGNEPNVKPAVYQRAEARRDPRAPQEIRRTQFNPAEIVQPIVEPAPVGSRRVRAFPRSSVPVQFRFETNPFDPSGQEQVATITSGVNIIIDGLPDIGQLDIATDRVVMWTRGLNPNLAGGQVQDQDQPLELYLEGNIVFRQGERVIHAQRMYYDVQRQVGTILDADVLTPLPNAQGFARLRAASVQQLGRDRFFAQQAYVTTSRLGEPRYRLQANQVFFEDTQQYDINFFTGLPNLDPATGMPRAVHREQVTARNNVVYLGQIPIGYWPVFSADMNDPAYFIRNVRVKNDSIFGTQFYTDLDLYQLLGITDRPTGTDWILGLDYLSRRGFAAGTTFDYQRDELFGVPGTTQGFFDYWGLSDHGLDRLGSDRYDLQPEETFRYRVLGKHRQELPNDWRLTGELGLVSDRNFLEQYFKQEWDQQKDQTTGLELKKYFDQQSLALSADVRFNDFFTQTERLPQLDHFLIGKPLLFDWLTWNTHTTAGYNRLRVASLPEDPTQRARTQIQPWEATVQGERFATRHEIDLPVNLGPVKVVPYALGEFAHWGQDLAGNDLDRLYGQAGVRLSTSFWTFNPEIESGLFNVHGLAHKVVLDADLSFSDANRDLDLLPLYEPLEDDAQEAFRRRFAFNTFNGVIPDSFDPRNYALRSGLGSWVSTGNTEIADDLTAFRLGARQRWQTKRGPLEQRRIIDWVTLDTALTLFPNPDRDNFGSIPGLATYDYRWHIGDRLTLLSDGQFDFFDQGLKYASVGLNLTRPPRLSLYAGFYTIGGPVNANTLLTSASFRLSPKWIASALALVDVEELGIIGNQLTLTRVGESFLSTFNFNYDRFRQNVGVNLTIEPRFLTRTKYGHVGGHPIPMAGLYGLE